MKAFRAAFWDALRHFERSEFSHPDEMDAVLLSLLDQARESAGVPFKITSSFRPDDEASSHSMGLAVDIACPSSWDRLRIVSGLLEVGFTRIGIYQHHVHVDIASDRASEVMWYGRYHPQTKEGQNASTSEDVSEEVQEGVPERHPESSPS
jgi:hypothetical protein